MNTRAGLVGKSTNLLLLLLFLLMILITSGITVYFGGQHDKLRTNLGDTSDNLTICRQEVSSCTTRLDQAVNSLNTTEEDIRKYDYLYKDKADSLEEAQKQLEQAVQNIRVEQIAKQKFKDLYTESQSQITDMAFQITTLEERIDKLDSDISKLNKKINCLKSTADADEGNC